MANLVITVANVRKRQGAEVLGGFAAVPITPGDGVGFRDDGLVYTARNSSAGAAVVSGVALNTASVNQPVDVLVSGNMDIGATLTVGTIYVISGSSGRIFPSADLSVGNIVSIIGIATTTSNLSVLPHASGVGAP